MHLLVFTISGSKDLAFSFVSLSCVAASLQESLLTRNGESLSA